MKIGEHKKTVKRPKRIGVEPIPIELPEKKQKEEVEREREKVEIKLGG